MRYWNHFIGDVSQNEDSFFDLDEAVSPSSPSFSAQLNGKVASESNSLFAEMSRLALMAMTKEQENKELKERIVFLEDQVTTARSKGNKTSDLVNVRIIIMVFMIIPFFLLW